MKYKDALPCPFCGCKKLYFCSMGITSEGELFCLGCCRRGCSCMGPTGVGKSGAIEAWNTRIIQSMFKFFMPNTRIFIDVVFPGEYRIGFQTNHRHYIPGSGSYYSFDEAMKICLAVYEHDIQEKTE